MFRMEECVRRSLSGYSYLLVLVLLMDLVGLCQVVDVSCPTVEKEYGKLVTIHTANKAPTELSHFVAIPWTFSPRAPGLPSEHVKETDRMQNSDSVSMQLGRVWYVHVVYSLTF